jgi:hypothetical protein
MPLRIVEIWVGPCGIVSGVKTPEAVERGDGLGSGLQVEGLGTEAQRPRRVRATTRLATPATLRTARVSLADFELSHDPSPAAGLGHGKTSPTRPAGTRWPTFDP